MENIHAANSGGGNGLAFSLYHETELAELLNVPLERLPGQWSDMLIPRWPHFLVRKGYDHQI
jgi:hypothetical protein